jgi:hypothetical protein
MTKLSFRSAALVLVASLALSSAQSWKRALESPYGAELKQCKEDWDVISKAGSDKVASCYHKLILSIRPMALNAKGIEALKVPQLDPLSVTETVTLGNSGGALTGNFTQMKVNGICGGLTPEKSEMRFDSQANTVTLVVTLPPGSASVDANYKIRLNVGSLFQDGSAQANAGGSITEGTVNALSTGPLVTTLTATLKKSKGGGYRVLSTKSDFTVQDVKFTLRGKNPDDPMTGLFNTVLASKETADLVIDAIRPSINKALATVLGSILNGGWKKLDDM